MRTTTVQVQVRLRPEELEILRRLAEADNRTPPNFIRHVLREKVLKHEQQPEA